VQNLGCNQDCRSVGQKICQASHRERCFPKISQPLRPRSARENREAAFKTGKKRYRCACWLIFSQQANAKAIGTIIDENEPLESIEIPIIRTSQMWTQHKHPSAGILT
jgi:hypothetical protein